jgi:superfamily I DNA and/or RNA helicase
VAVLQCILQLSLIQFYTLTPEISSGRKDYEERKETRRELRRLAKEERQRQQLAVKEVLSSARVVCTTLTGVGSRQLDGQAFDLVVIDEAAQARYSFLLSLLYFQNIFVYLCLKLGVTSMPVYS